MEKKRIFEAPIFTNWDKAYPKNRQYIMLARNGLMSHNKQSPSKVSIENIKLTLRGVSAVSNEIFDTCKQANLRSRVPMVT